MVTEHGAQAHVHGFWQSVGLYATRVTYDNRNDNSSPPGYRRNPNFRPADRLTGFLMRPSVDERLSEKHLACFVVEVIDGPDLTATSKSHRGSGSTSYRPAVLPADLRTP